MSLITSLLIVLILSPIFINYIKKKNILQIIRSNGPITHINNKCNTPTMGGVIILTSIFITVIIWSNLLNLYIIYTLIILLIYAVIGFVDDYYKIILKHHQGLYIKQKLLLQSVVTFIMGTYIYYQNNKYMSILQINIPFYKNIFIYTNYFIYIIITYMIIVGLSNAINLTDGLDGLVIMPIIFTSIGLIILCFITGDIDFSKYFNVQYIKYSKELSIICCSLIGSGLGFLWFNTYPAIIFMGDVGSLTLGSIIGLIIILIRQEFLSLIMCGIFIIEALSVMIQIFMFKLKKKRVLLMAPIHHHFELQGCPEPRIIVRFWIISLILIFCAIAILQINHI
nr:phospho-N-acetylmuramoyl-pentapeptide-transferase [Enterobacteriaceae endosymbiont of Neohaemonia nigricornis]